MTEPTLEDPHAVAALAERHGFSSPAVGHLLEAVAAGGGHMAMFDHPEFGGAGQWMRGGMILLGDASNHALKARVDAPGDMPSGDGPATPTAADTHVLEVIERLGDLKAKGLLSEDEFAAKKAELLARL